MTEDTDATPSDDEAKVPPPEPALPRIAFTEGSIGLPAGYEDRSHNLLVPADTQAQPNLSIARDWMKDEETVEKYLERQLGRLKSQLASHKVLRQGALTLPLGANDSDATALHGLVIDATHRNGKLVVHQRQAVFEAAPMRALIFTASSPNGFGENFERLWCEWLASYQAPPAEAPPDSTPRAPDA